VGSIEGICRLFDVADIVSETNLINRSMRNYIILLVSFIFLFSCKEEDAPKNNSYKIKPFVRDSIAGPYIPLKPLELPKSISSFSVEDIEEKLYTQAENKGCKLVKDTSYFHKIGDKLLISDQGKLLYTFQDSFLFWDYIGEPKIDSIKDAEPYDNLGYMGMGYYLVNNEKWFLIVGNGYEYGVYLILPPPYTKIYTFKTEPSISPSSAFLFDFWFTGLGGFDAQWSLYVMPSLKELSTLNFNCALANSYGDKKTKRPTVPLCPQIVEEVKWVSEKELVMKVLSFNDEEAPTTNKVQQSRYLKVKIN
jgi:hypothetical protein